MRSSRGSEEGPTGGMLRAPELLRRPEEDDPALLHQPDRVAEQQPLTHVVRHEDDRRAETPLQREELALQLDARDGIERPERLIQQEERRVGGERPSDADPLALPTRQLVGVASTEHAGIEADQGEELAHARGDARGGPPLEARHQTDVALDREVREQPDLLDDVADAAAPPGGLERVRGPSGDPDLARRGLEQTIDQLKGRGLARAAAPEQHQCFPGSHAEGHRSEEHTSELQSQSNLVCRLLLEKKKNRANLHEHANTLLRHVIDKSANPKGSDKTSRTTGIASIISQFTQFTRPSVAHHLYKRFR